MFCWASVFVSRALTGLRKFIDLTPVVTTVNYAIYRFDMCELGRRLDSIFYSARRTFSIVLFFLIFMLFV